VRPTSVGSRPSGPSSATEEAQDLRFKRETGPNGDWRRCAAALASSSLPDPAFLQRPPLLLELGGGLPRRWAGCSSSSLSLSATSFGLAAHLTSQVVLGGDMSWRSGPSQPTARPGRHCLIAVAPTSTGAWRSSGAASLAHLQHLSSACRLTRPGRAPGFQTFLGSVSRSNRGIGPDPAASNRSPPGGPGP